MFDEFTRESEMKKSLLIIFLSLIFAVSCGGGAMKIGEKESEQEQEETQTDNDADTDPSADEGETTQDDTGTAQKDGEITNNEDDKVPDDDADTAQDDGDPDTDTDTNTEVTDDNGVTDERQCEGLPENAEWNTYKCMIRIWGNDDFCKSTEAAYNEVPAESMVVVSQPEPHNSAQVPCPEGTAPKNGKCVECGTIIPGAYIEESDSGTVFQDANGKTAIEQCFSGYNESSGNLIGSAMPCCGSGTLYRIKSKKKIELPQPYTYNGEPLPNTVSGCKNDETFEETTGKCYFCDCGELKTEDGLIKCYTEYGSECRFKCKAGFKWNGESCI